MKNNENGNTTTAAETARAEFDKAVEIYRAFKTLKRDAPHLVGSFGDDTERTERQLNTNMFIAATKAKKTYLINRSSKDIPLDEIMKDCLGADCPAITFEPEGDAADDDMFPEAEEFGWDGDWAFDEQPYYGHNQVVEALRAAYEAGERAANNQKRASK